MADENYKLPENLRKAALQLSRQRGLPVGAQPDLEREVARVERDRGLPLAVTRAPRRAAKPVAEPAAQPTPVDSSSLLEELGRVPAAQDERIQPSYEMREKEAPADKLSGVGEFWGRMNDAQKTALLTGATPLLVGLLTGHVGDAASIAGKGLMTQVQGDLEHQRKKDLLERRALAQQQQAGQRRRFSFAPVEGPDGEMYLAKQDTFTGEVSPVDSEGKRLKRAYRKSFRVDPETGELVVGSGTSGELTEPTKARSSKSPFTVKEEKDIRDWRSKVESNKTFQKNKEVISSSGRAIELLNLGNPVADEGIKVIFPRMFGEVGNLAVTEQERFTGSPELRRKYERLKERWLEGTLSDEDRSDLVEVARTMQMYSQSRMKEFIQGQIGSEKFLSGLPEDQLMYVVKPLLPRGRKPGKIAETVKKTKQPGQVIEKMYKGKKIKLKLRPDGKYEEVK